MLRVVKTLIKVNHVPGMLWNNLMLQIIGEAAFFVKKYIECVHMTSRRPCWRSKQRNGGHVGGVKYSFGD